MDTPMVLGLVWAGCSCGAPREHELIRQGDSASFRCLCCGHVAQLRNVFAVGSFAAQMARWLDGYRAVAA